MYQGRYDDARAMLVKYHGGGDVSSPLVAQEYEEIRQTLEFEKTVQKTSFQALFSTRPNRWRIGITIAVGVFCQLSGNNTITYYLGDVLDSAGVTSVNTQLAINIGISVWNLICAAIGSVYVDRMGRRIEFRKLRKSIRNWKIEVLTLHSRLDRRNGRLISHHGRPHQAL